MGIPIVAGVVRCARSFYQLLGNRRKFERAPITGAIYITTKGYAIDTTRLCSLVDMSPQGIGIDCPESLAIDSFVQVHSDQQGPRRVARVRHCRRHNEVYRAGLQFVPQPDA